MRRGGGLRVQYPESEGAVRVAFAIFSVTASYGPVSPFLSSARSPSSIRIGECRAHANRKCPQWPSPLLLCSPDSAESLPGASTTSAKSLAKDLMTTSYAKAAGFTAVAEKVSTSAKTGVKSCPDGAQEAFENTSNQTGVIAEILRCQNKKAAAALLTSIEADGAESSSPPKQLGSSAWSQQYRTGVHDYWRQGDVFAFVGLETQIPASSSASTTTTTAPAPPITAAEQKVLSSAAQNQFKQVG